MDATLLREITADQIKSDLPEFGAGDTLRVHVRVIEGDKERVQIFSGVVIRISGHGISETFTVRRIVNKQGVERTFPLHSPKVSAVKVLRGGKTRRAKLYFLRDRVGKATRLKQPAVQKKTAKPKA